MVRGRCPQCQDSQPGPVVPGGDLGHHNLSFRTDILGHYKLLSGTDILGHYKLSSGTDIMCQYCYLGQLFLFIIPV